MDVEGSALEDVGAEGPRSGGNRAGSGDDDEVVDPDALAEGRHSAETVAAQSPGAGRHELDSGADGGGGVGTRADG